MRPLRGIHSKGERVFVVFYDRPMIAAIYEVLRSDREFAQGSSGRLSIVGLVSANDEELRVRNFEGVIHGWDDV